MNDSFLSSAKLEDPFRIFRIFKKLSNNHFPIYLRSSHQPNIAVRGRIGKIFVAEKNHEILDSIELNDITEKGMAFLRQNQNVQCEFVMLSSKIVFQTKIIEISSSHIQIQAPDVLMSVERRKSNRYKVPKDISVYLRLSNISKEDSSISYPVFFPYERLYPILTIIDLSVGGLCAQSRYPFFYENILTGYEDLNSTFYFPMEFPMTSPVVVRWVKKTTEHSTVQGEAPTIYYRFGFEFKNEFKNREALLNLIQKFHHSQSI